MPGSPDSGELAASSIATVTSPTFRPPRVGFVPRSHRPRTIEVAYWLLAGNAAVGGVIGLLRCILDPSERLPPVAIAIVIVIDAALLIWLARRIRAGANWARVTTTVLAVTALPYLAGGWIAALITMATQIAAVVLLWVPASGRYVRAVRAQRADAVRDFA